MTSRIETLVQQLDGEADESYDARAELIWIGTDAIPAVINGLPSLGGFGQLTAIEVFEEVGDPRCGPALIGLLDSDNPAVREWAAMALKVVAEGSVLGILSVWVGCCGLSRCGWRRSRACGWIGSRSW
ncbi:HEAT repeat domain-containing protein [Streptomyces albidoflavus]|uniref:HEAT repeat domain-containing protein n=1 Tax=Streptomyces albidoflavus TaxID=1886 RepID=UPI0021D5F469|nr:hypothetical protein [Streptomyces albidoflavus]MCU7703246.1 hypothetical protein [Streptomyces albidoflavus]